MNIKAFKPKLPCGGVQTLRVACAFSGVALIMDVGGLRCWF